MMSSKLSHAASKHTETGSEHKNQFLYVSMWHAKALSQQHVLLLLVLSLSSSCFSVFKQRFEARFDMIFGRRSKTSEFCLPLPSKPMDIT